MRKLFPYTVLSIIMAAGVHDASAFDFATGEVIHSGDPQRPVSVVESDLDGDGDPDYLVTFALADIGWLENRLQESEGDFNSIQLIRPNLSSIRARFAITADMDNDLDEDIIFTQNASNGGWLENRLNEPENDFLPPVSIPGNGSVSSDILAADFDLDNDTDLVLSGERTVWMPNEGSMASPIFSQQIPLEQSYRSINIAAADLDSDGDPDILQPYEETGMPSQYFWYSNNAIGTGDGFGSDQLIATWGNSPLKIITTDLDMDNDPDIVLANIISTVGGTAAWIENTINQELDDFSEVREFSLSTDFVSSVSSGDLDGDGDPDLILGSDPNENIIIYENRLNEASNDLLRSETVLNAGSNVIDVLVTDSDQDGDLDLIAIL